jgi:diguanylate cyclase (GGDEF)-like protein
MAPIQAPMFVDKNDNARARNVNVPKSWADLQESLAASSGLALLLIDGRQPPALQVSNNNSICNAFQSSPSFNHYCEKYCGTAHKRVTETESVEHFRCHAGLQCFAMPIETGGECKLAIIGGRAFLNGTDYRRLVERIMTGDLKGLFDSALFNNVIFSNRDSLDELLKKVQQATKKEFAETTEIEIPKIAQPSVKEKSQPTVDLRSEVYLESSPLAEAAGLAAKPVSEPIKAQEPKNQKREIPEKERPIVEKKEKPYFDTKEGRTEEIPISSGAFYLSETSKRNYVLLLKPLTDKHGFRSVSLLVRHGSDFIPVYLMGAFRHSPVQIQLDPWDERLFDAAKNETSIMLRPLAKKAEGQSVDSQTSGNTIELFPMIYRDDVLGVLLIGETLRHSTQRREVSAFCREAALQLEIIRLNVELEKRASIFASLKRLAEQVNVLEPNETYRSILAHSSELLGAERASLLLFDEETNELKAKAALGPQAKEVSNSKLGLGEGIAGKVFQQGRPIVADDIKKKGYLSDPHRNYKTKSFISYPLIISGRRLGVLNLTDKSGGGVYDERDLRLIDSIVPHLALAIGRAEWQERASEFELMSITDPLTGLLNRRYLEERMDEEIKRSQRNNFPMGFLMIDIDDFKFYNDNNGHQAGDKALEITAQCLRAVLRAHDVASRYGGEEFSILLPQTTIEEAVVIAERIRHKVESEHFPNGENQPLGKVTVSIGVSAYSTMLNNTRAIIGAADRALYLAKNENKNLVRVLDGPEPLTPFVDATENSN